MQQSDIIKQLNKQSIEYTLGRSSSVSDDMDAVAVVSIRKNGDCTVDCSKLNGTQVSLMAQTLSMIAHQVLAGNTPVVKSNSSG